MALGLAGVDYGPPTVTLGAVLGAVLAVVPFPVASQRVVRSAGRSLLRRHCNNVVRSNACCCNVMLIVVLMSDCWSCRRSLTAIDDVIASELINISMSD